MTESNVIAWLDVRTHETDIVTAEGPFRNTTDEKGLLRARLWTLCLGHGVSPEALNLLLPWIFLSPSDKKVIMNPNDSNKNLYTVNWRLETNEAISERIEKVGAHGQQVNLFTVRTHDVSNAPQFVLDPSNAENMVKPYIVSGHAEFNVGPDVHTFLTKEEAIKYAKGLHEAFPSSPEFRHDCFDVEPSPKGCGVLFGVVGSPSGCLQQLVSVTRVQVFGRLRDDMRISDPGPRV